MGYFAPCCKRGCRALRSKFSSVTWGITVDQGRRHLPLAAKDARHHRNGVRTRDVEISVSPGLPPRDQQRQCRKRQQRLGPGPAPDYSPRRWLHGSRHLPRQHIAAPFDEFHRQTLRTRAERLGTAAQQHVGLFGQRHRPVLEQVQVLHQVRPVVLGFRRGAERVVCLVRQGDRAALPFGHFLFEPCLLLGRRLDAFTLGCQVVLGRVLSRSYRVLTALTLAQGSVTMSRRSGRIADNTYARTPGHRRVRCGTGPLPAGLVVRRLASRSLALSCRKRGSSTSRGSYPSTQEQSGPPISPSRFAGVICHRRTWQLRR